MTIILYDKNPENEEGELHKFIRIIVADSNRENCLYTQSLFYCKTTYLLIKTKDNIKKEDYFKTPITQ